MEEKQSTEKGNFPLLFIFNTSGLRKDNFLVSDQMSVISSYLFHPALSNQSRIITMRLEQTSGLEALRVSPQIPHTHIKPTGNEK